MLDDTSSVEKDESTQDQQLFRCLYCEKYFTADHINPYVLDESEFHYLKNFSKLDEIDQGHLCEPFQRYCKKREIELQQKYARNKDISSSPIDTLSNNTEIKTTLHGSINRIEQVIDEKGVNEKPSDFPDNFDEWIHKKLQEKREF